MSKRILGFLLLVMSSKNIHAQGYKHWLLPVIYTHVEATMDGNAALPIAADLGFCASFVLISNGFGTWGASNSHSGKFYAGTGLLLASAAAFPAYSIASIFDGVSIGDVPKTNRAIAGTALYALTLFWPSIAWRLGRHGLALDIPLGDPRRTAFSLSYRY